MAILIASPAKQCVCTCELDDYLDVDKGESQREGLLTHPGSRRLLTSDITWKGLAQEGLKSLILLFILSDFHFPSL